MIEKIKGRTIETAFGLVEELTSDQAKINEIIEASNRQEQAILELADSHEDGSWQGQRERIDKILNH